MNLLRGMACVAAVLVAPAAALASFPGTNGRIAFTTFNADTVLHVFTINPDGSGFSDLTGSWLEEMQPTFSPDGASIAFSSTRDGNAEVYVMAADGTGVTRVTNDAAEDVAPAFTADGSRIAFASDRDGHWQIYSVRRDGSDLIRLVTSATNDTDPTLSADGSRLAFSSDRDGNREIYVARSDGADPVRITSDPAADAQPSFAPDGGRITFTSWRAGGVGHIYVMDADGSSPVPLPSSPTSADHDPSFSPDGTKVVFGGDFVCPPGMICGATLAGALYVTTSDGSGARTAVISTPWSDPDWGVGTPATPTPTPTPSPAPTLTPSPTPTPTPTPSPTPSPNPAECAAANGNDVQIPDLSTVESAITITGCPGNASATAALEVHIAHTYIGDLIVTLVAPDGSSYLLHNRAGGSADNLDQIYTVNLSTEPANGTWKLRVQDAAAADVGRIDSWTISP